MTKLYNKLAYVGSSSPTGSSTSSPTGSSTTAPGTSSAA